MNRNFMGYYGAGMYGGQTPRVNGRKGAEDFQMLPNSSVILLDTSAPLVWYKETDSAGVPSLAPYKIEAFAEPTPPPPADANTVAQMLAEMEQRITANLSKQMEAMIHGTKSDSGRTDAGESLAIVGGGGKPAPTA